MITRMVVIYSLLLTIFFEAVNLSFYFMGARIRVSQLIEIAALLYLIIGFLLSKFRIKTTLIDIPLLGYLAVNVLSVYNSSWQGRSVKISLLLTSLILLYYIIVNLINSRAVFEKAIHFLMIVGIVEIGYGIYQVFAGMLNASIGLNLPIGSMGMVHGKYIGASWGRPYGTFVEPDWYGTMCMYFLLIFAPVYYDLQLNKKRRFYLIGLSMAVVGLFFSFVRAAWLGFFVGAGILILYNMRDRVLRVNIIAIVRKVLIAAFILLILVIAIPPIRNVILERLNPTYDTNAQLSFKNVRFRLMGISFSAMLDHPLIGNGPGSAGYSYLVNDYGSMRAKEMIKSPNLLKGIEGYDPSIITTILSDTGLIGIFMFLWLLIEIVRLNVSKIGKFKGSDKSLSVGLFAGFMALIASYVFTQGLWLPFTWVFLALNMVALKFGTFEGQKLVEK